MKVRYLGTGAAEGVPAMYCRCETCQEIRKRGESEFHTRAQYIIDDKIGVDFPPDAYYHALKFHIDLSAIEHLFITHSHMDHFYAHDFILRGYKYASPIENKLYIYGNAEVCKVYAECTQREMRAEVGRNIEMREVFPFTKFSFGEGYTAIPLPARHGDKETSLVYLIEKGDTAYLHLTDTGRLPEKTLAYLETYFKGDRFVGFVTFDCTFLFHTPNGISRHMSLEDNKAMQDEFLKRGIANERTGYAITHYSHNNAPFSETLKRAEKEYGYKAAFDGMEVIF